MKKKFTDIKNIIFDLGGVIIDIDQNQIINHLRDNGFNNLELLNSDEVKHTLKQFECGILSAETFRKRLCSQAGNRVLKFTQEVINHFFRTERLKPPASFCVKCPMLEIHERS